MEQCTFPGKTPGEHPSSRLSRWMPFQPRPGSIGKNCTGKNPLIAAAIISGHQNWPKFHRENGGTLGMVPLIINPIYTLCRGYVLGISPFKGLLGGVKQQGYHPKGTRHLVTINEDSCGPISSCQSWLFAADINIPHSIHAWYIYLHLP